MRDRLAGHARTARGIAAAPLLVALLVVALVIAVVVGVQRAGAARDEAARLAAAQALLLDVLDEAQADARGGSFVVSTADVEAAIARIDPALLDDPTRAAAPKIAAGRLYLKIGQFERATALLANAVTAAEQETSDARELAIARRWYGRALVDGARFAEAETVLRAAVAWHDAHPGDAREALDARAALFDAVMGQGRAADAATIAQQAIGGITDDVPMRARIAAHLDLATAWHALAKPADAVAAATQAVNLARGAANAQRELARALATLGTLQREAADCAVAARTLQEAVRLDRDGDRAERAARQDALAQAHLCTGDGAAARNAAAEAVALQTHAFNALDPDVGRYRETHARALVLQGDFAGAEADLRNAVQIAARAEPRGSPVTRRHHQALAGVLVPQGKLDEAAMLYAASLDGLAGDTPAERALRFRGELGHAAVALARGDVAQARERLAAAQTAAPPDAERTRDDDAELARLGDAIAAAAP